MSSEFLWLIFFSFCLNFALIVLICLEKKLYIPFMIDLLRLKALGTGLAFGYDRQGL
jgi:hypothetical protein